MEELEARRTALEAAEAERAAPPFRCCIRRWPRSTARRSPISRARLAAPDTRHEAADILRGLIEAIELHPATAGYEILLRGDLAGILRLAVDGEKPATVSGGGLSQMALVAGTGFEPVTFRL